MLLQTRGHVLDVLDVQRRAIRVEFVMSSFMDGQCRGFIEMCSHWDVNSM